MVGKGQAWRSQYQSKSFQRQAGGHGFLELLVKNLSDFAVHVVLIVLGRSSGLDRISTVC